MGHTGHISPEILNAKQRQNGQRQIEEAFSSILASHIAEHLKDGFSATPHETLNGRLIIRPLQIHSLSSNHLC